MFNTPDRYSCVSITDDAQFGINPISPAINAPSIGLFDINPPNASSPIILIIIFYISDIIKINTNTFTVCFIADFHIPSSQWQCSCSHKSSMFSSFSSL